MSIWKSIGLLAVGSAFWVSVLMWALDKLDEKLGGKQ